MNEIDTSARAASLAPSLSTRRKRVFVGILAGIILTCAIVAITLWAKYKYLRAHADAILRDRVIASLSARFHSPVELDSFHLDIGNGVHVTGTGLRILYLAGPTRPDANPVAPPPMLSIANFEFQTDFKELLEPTTRIVTVFVHGMTLDIPPHRPRAAGPRDNPKRRGQPRISIAVDRIVCTDSHIVIETSKPGGLPLVFDLANVTLTDVGAKKPLLYDANLTNPKPVGQVHATGHFGPWQDDDPRDTPIDGNYSFTNADLGPFKGIAGILSSSGTFDGKLGHINVQGSSDTPDFRLDISDHPVPLHTNFRAEINGFNGDTKLDQVDAKLLNSSLHASGAIIRVGTLATGVTGHDIQLDVKIGPGDRARIEDLLALAVKTSPPIMRGNIVMQEHLSIPPGKESVSKKMRMNGNFAIRDVTFSNPKLQTTVDKLSMRAQGRPQDANPANAEKVESGLTGAFNQANSVIDFSTLNYSMPGATVHLTGQYSLDGLKFEFKGEVRTQATISQMTTGWKSMLLKPFDPLLKRDGAGVELPVTISGTKSAPKFGIDTKRLFR